jgi:hypothetical protein
LEYLCYRWPWTYSFCRSLNLLILSHFMTYQRLFNQNVESILLTNKYMTAHCPVFVRRVWRYQRRKQNLYIEEEQTTQWSKEKVQKDAQVNILFIYLYFFEPKTKQIWHCHFILKYFICPFVLFLLTIVLSVLLRYTDSVSSGKVL